MSAAPPAAPTGPDALALKNEANELFQAGKVKDACKVYSDALMKADENDKKLKQTLYSNRAMCRLKLKEFEECVKDCDQALEIEGGNIKVLYRRAKAYAEMKKVQEAYKDMRLLLDIDKDNKAAIQFMKELKALASDMSSTTTQTMEIIENISKESTSQNERNHKLRQLLGSVMDDTHLSLSISMKGACEKLWSLRTMDPLALKILSKMSEYEKCFEYVMKAVNQKELEEIITTNDGNDDGSAAALSMLWRLFKHEDQLKEKDETYESQINQEETIKIIVMAIKSENEDLRRIAIEAVVRICGEQEERSKLFVKLDGMNALMSLIERDYNRNEPIQQVSVVLGQTLPALKDDELIKSNALNFCKPLLLSNDVHEQIRGVAALDAIYYANKELGEELVKVENLIEPLQKIARYGSARGQALTCEVFSNVANTEPGRELLAGDATDTLKMLAVSDTPEVRSNAAVTLAKLNAIDFNAESENGVLVLSSVVNLLRAEASKEEHAKGVEAISFVITDSLVKMMLIKGEGLAVLKELILLGTENASEHYGYGLSFIFENITMSQDDKRREKLREMEVTEEQWDQFEKLTKSQTRKPGQEDPKENVEMRINVFVGIQGIGALRSLILNGKSERVWEAAARTLCNIATVQQVRGQMIAQGALRALFKLTSSGTEKCQKFAAHALAKIFVTTDPHVLKDEQLMDTIEPLVRQVRHSDEDLIIFECCMALTNIATVSDESKQKIVTARGIQAFEYAQYSDNLLVRRSATEAINNLIPAEEVVEWICQPEKMRLWLLFALGYEEDVATSCAATGALANLAIDERVAEALSKQEENALLKILNLACSENLDLVLRAVVCLLNLVESWPNEQGKKVFKENGVDKVMEEIIKRHGDTSARDPAKQLLDMLNA